METKAQRTQPGKSALWKSAVTFVLAAIDVYLILVLSLVLAAKLGGQRFWPIEFASNFLHWLLIPAWFLLIGLAAARRWRRASLAAAASLIFVWLFGGLFLPNPQRACAAGPEVCMPLRVMSYNMFGIPHADYTTQIATIRDSGADIVALQEVSEGAAAAVEPELADLYPHRFLHPIGIPGTGLLSKYPILSAEAIQLAPDALWNTRAVLDVNGVPVTVISAHPPPPGWTLRGGYQSRGTDQIRQLVAMAAEGGPTLLIGDFNIVDQSPDYRLLADAGLHDAFREAGWGFGSTWHDRYGRFTRLPPLIRLDYVWYTDHFRAVDAWVGPTAESDHRPVIADLVFTN